MSLALVLASSLVSSTPPLLVTAKILQEAIYLTSPTWAKSLTKFNSKMQDFERVVDLNCKKKEDQTI